MPTTPATLLVASGGNLATTAGATQYWICATSHTGGDTTEANKQIPYRYAGIFSKLYIRITANSTTAPSSFSLRKNGSTVNLTITIPTGSSGVFEDTSHTDSIAAGDLMAYQTISGGTGTFTLSLMSIYFANTQSSEAVTKMAAAAPISLTNFNVASVSRFMHLAGNISSIITEALGAHDRIMKAGTLKNMSVNVATNARVTDCTMKSRINAADGTLLITIAAGTTGLFEDITHSDTVAEGDLVDTVVVYSTGSETINYWYFAIDYVAATNQRFTMLNTAGSAITTNAAVTNYFAVTGGIATGATEGQRQVKAREAMTLTNMSIMIAANSLTSPSSSTLRLRKNGSDANLLITIPFATTGVFNDLSNSDSIVATDDINYQLIAGATGTSIQSRSINLNAHIPLTLVKTSSDTKTIGETITRLKKVFKTLSETETIGGTVARINAFFASIAAQSITIGDSVIRLATRAGVLKTLTETIVISELKTRVKAIWRYQP